MSDMQHPDPAEIAALDEELLPPAEAAVLRAHLADCPSCAAVADDLTALRQALHDLPLPPMPDDVVARLDAALGELHVSRETVTAPVPPPTPEPTDSTDPSPAPAPASSTESLAEPPSEGRVHASSAVPLPPADTPPREKATTRRSVPVRKRWPQFALAAAGAVLAVALGSIALESLGTGTSGAGDSSVADAQGDSAMAADPILEEQVRDLLAESEAAGALPLPENAPEPDRSPDASAWRTEEQPSAPEQEDTGSMDESEDAERGGESGQPDVLLAQVPSCVEDAIGRSEAPLAAEAEDYAGTEAYLVVFPHAVDPGQVDAYVVDADCVSATPPVSGEVLVRASYPRD